MTTTTGVPAADGIHPGIEESAYHADRGSLSVSGAKLLLPPSCPALFKERMDNPPPPKREYTVGHLVHKMVLGEGAEIAEIEAPDYRTKAAREARDQAHADGHIPALTSEIMTARAMADTVHSHPIAGPLFEDGQPEQSMYHTDPETGVRLRGRTDWITEIGGRTTIVDFKTQATTNPVEMAHNFYRFGYHMQRAWYVDLAAALGISDDPDFVFVAQEKVPPYLVTVVRYDDEAIAEGRRLNRQAIETYARCVESGVWPGYTDQIVTLSLPRWALHDSIQTDADALIAELEGMTA